MSLSDKLNYEPAELNFGTSGLRGLVTDMTDLECYINTRGFLDFVKDDSDKPVESICLAGDLRDSTPRIMRAVAQAIIDSGFKYQNCGLIPTPALAYWSQEQGRPGIMVTGSHIPADRNGIKFYKVTGEVLKNDEVAIKSVVSKVRAAVYASDDDRFDEQGQLVAPPKLEQATTAAEQAYRDRYLNVFTDRSLAGHKIVMYQHSAVGRDLIAEMFEALGAEVIREGRSEKFVPIDTENVTPKDASYFRSLAKKHPGCLAIVSTDGDSDRPFMIDSDGIFHNGDVLGLPVSEYLGIEAVALPVSANDAALQYLDQQNIESISTRIGSPYVIAAMQKLETKYQRVAGWEVNGGYLLGSDIELPGGTLKALATRDAFLPLVCTMLQAVEQEIGIAELFASYPKRYTFAGLIDDFPVETSKKIIALLADPANATKIMSKLPTELQFSDIESIDTTDGDRIRFKNDDVMHIRPSGNAPQLRVYSNADSQDRANQIVELGIQEPDGILRRLEKLA